MQLNFTRQTKRFLLKTLVIFGLAIPGILNAQTISTASGTNYLGDYSINNPAPLVQTFAIRNTNATPVVLSDISMQMAPYFTATAGAPSAITLYYSSTSLSGPATVGAPGWTQIASYNTTVPAALTTIPVIVGANFSIPAGAEYRFAIVATKGMAFSFSPTPTPNSFTAGGIFLEVGNYQIAGQNVGYTGVFPDLPAANTPVFFGGSVSFVSAVPCTGTPNPGNTLSSVPSVCPGINFTLSYQNQPPAGTTGLTYQWQSASAIGGPYSNIGGATAASYSTQLTATTYYQVMVTCGANTGTSNPVQVLLTPSSGCYCDAGATSTAFEKISNVTFGTINNNSTSTAGYENFTNLSTDMIQGQVAPISVTISGPFASDQVIVWIDFNRNGNFLDPGEEVYRSPQGAGPHVGNITISPTATLGPTRMRVRMHDAALGANGTPCGNSTYGQVEDYTVNILPCINVSITGQPASASVQCSSNATFTVTATGSALIYAWEYRVNSASPWQNVTNTGIYSGATTNALTLTNVPATMSGYQYRAVISNPCTALDFTSTATLTVVPLVATVNPTSATICTGSVQQLTLTNASSPTTQTFTATGLPIAIPDNNTTGINSTIPVTLPAGSVITRVDVRFSVPAHTWPGDMAVVLRAPNGQILNLDYFISATGAGPGAGMVNTVISSAGGPLLSSVSAPYTGTFRADAVLTGAPAAGPVGFLPTTTTWTPLYSTPSGNWTLAIYDAFGGDFGSLTAWSLDITYGAPSAGVWTASPATPNTMWTNAGATVPYVAGTPVTTIWVNPTVNTNYSVVYTTATPCTSAPTVIPVTVVNPVGTVTQPANRAACIGGSATFTASATGGPNSYQWQVSSDGGATWTDVSGATTTSLTVSNVTATMNNYRYRLQINAAPCTGTTTSSAATLTVNNPPTVTLASPDLALAPGQNTTLTVTSNPAAAVGGYRWTLNGVALPASTNSQNIQTIGIDALGEYRVSVTDVNGCVGQSNTLTIGAEASDKLWIYPNPSPGAFQVRLYYGGTTTERRTVSIFTMGGQLVEQREFTLNSNSNPYLRMDFDLSKMADAIYVVKVHNRHTNQIVSGMVVVGRD